MTQHVFRTTANDRPVSVLMGYDRILDYVFCVVQLLDCNDDDDESPFLYSNMEDPDALTYVRDIREFASKLRDVGITVPGSMYDAVNDDFIARTAPYRMTHFVDRAPVREGEPVRS